ncbi:MAG: O-antigen ligase family protein [Planctomycetes bacterium]|nr:O-antigen ligase family protein [Planctomycetota bacterium]
MEYINEKSRSASLFSIHVVVSLVVLIVTLLEFKGATGSYYAVEEVVLGPYKFFMLSVCSISFLVFMFFSINLSKDNLFLWFAVLYAFVAILSTSLVGIYPMMELPFKFVKMSYWVWIMVISYYSVLHLNTFKYHVAIAGIFLPILVFFFFATMQTNRGVGSMRMLALNSVFYISFLMPAILLLRSKTLKMGGVLLIFFAILLSYKRSAMIAFVTSIPVYLYATSNNDSKSKIKKYIPIILGGAFLLVVLAISFNFISSAIGLDWGGRMEDITSSGGSGRYDRYIAYIRLMSSQSAQDWLIGHGYAFTQFTPISWPHNDVLEVLFDFGIVGLTFYLLFISQLVKLFFQMKKYKYKHFDAFAVSLVIFFWGSMFSILIVMPQWYLCLAFFWGWVIADFHNAKKCGDPEKIANPLYTAETEYVYVDEQGNVYDDETEEVVYV